VETASGIKPIFAGKPEPAMIEYALEEMELKPEETLQVGDRLDTDILGGIRANCKTALVLSGISTLEELTSSDIKPDFVFKDLQSMFN